MALIEKRVEYLFPDKGRCLIETAVIFAEMRDSSLTQSNTIDLLGKKPACKKFAPSTIRKAFRELSAPMEVLGGHSYIDIEVVSTNRRGRPILKGKLSRIAFERNQWNLGKRACLLPSEIVSLVKQKIGAQEANRLLTKLIQENYATMCDEITETHRWGRPPLHQFRIENIGLMKFLADQNQKSYATSISIVDPQANQHSLDDTRVHAAKELSICGDPKGIDQLIMLLKDDSEYARLNAAKELGALREPKAVDTLISMLNDTSELVRICSIEALGDIGAERAMDPLRKLLSNDPDTLIKDYATKTLKKIQKASI